VTTAQTIVDQARRDLLAGVVEERNKLLAQINSTATTLQLQYDPRGVRDGNVIEIGSELLYVWGVQGPTVTVERGFQGTTAATHAAGAIITVKPRFPNQMMLDHVNDELTDLSSPANGLFQIKVCSRNYNGTDRAVDLTGVTDLLSIHEVRWKYDNDEWIEVRRWRLSRDAATADFASGLMLIFDMPPPQAAPIRVAYKAPYTRLASLSQDLTSVGGVQASLEDVVRMGVQLRAMVGREVKRNFIEGQGDTRRAQEVGPGAVQASWRGIAAMRQQRIEAEQARLYQAYPMRTRKY
jgi:hypothetical protein